MSLFGSKTTNTESVRLQVFVFKSIDWGFTDASLPKVRVLVDRLSGFGADVATSHNSLIVRIRGERCARNADVSRLLEEARCDPVFDGFVTGFAEGTLDNQLSASFIAAAALKNANDQANQSSDPTLSSGTSPAGQEPRHP
jgi:hypothetical protein